MREVLHAVSAALAGETIKPVFSRADEARSFTRAVRSARAAAAAAGANWEAVVANAFDPAASPMAHPPSASVRHAASLLRSMAVVLYVSVALRYTLTLLANSHTLMAL